MMIMVVYGLQTPLLSVTMAARGVCVFVCANALLSLCFCLCVRTCQILRVRKRGVIAAESGYCVLYQADKPIRGTTIDINFPSIPLSPLGEVFFI